jgi:hypothetical protein
MYNSPIRLNITSLHVIIYIRIRNKDYNSGTTQSYPVITVVDVYLDYSETFVMLYNLSTIEIAEASINHTSFCEYTAGGR